jgi:hypothetical protein
MLSNSKSGNSLPKRMRQNKMCDLIVHVHEEKKKKQNKDSVLKSITADHDALCISPSYKRANGGCCLFIKP